MCHLSSQPRIEPMPSVLEAQSLNHWTIKKFQSSILKPNYRLKLHPLQIEAEALAFKILNVTAFMLVNL